MAPLVEFITSAAQPADLPRDGSPEVALVGRSNVGKSSLINALAGRSVARTSGTPGKTRLVNVYRVDAERRGGAGGGIDRPFYLIDLPGYGYARGARADPSFRAAADAYAQARWRGADAPPGGALLLVDGRHPGLDNDLAAYDWLASIGRPAAVVATKFDKLTRAERPRARQALETAFHGPVLPVSAAAGEGLKELWKLIDRLLSRQPPRLQQRPPSSTSRR